MAVLVVLKLEPAKPLKQQDLSKQGQPAELAGLKKLCLLFWKFYKGPWGCWALIEAGLFTHGSQVWGQQPLLQAQCPLQSSIHSRLKGPG